jgi:hypothetical protein
MCRIPGPATILVRSHRVLAISAGLWVYLFLSLAGLNMWQTAHLFYLLRSEFPLVLENLLHLTL